MNRAILCALLLLAAPVHAGVPAPAASAQEASAAEFDGHIAKLADANALIRLTAGDAIALTPPDSFAALEARLLRTPEANSGPMWVVLDKARKALPETATEADVLKGVLEAGSSPAHRSVALFLAGIRACEKQGGTPGARVLVHLSVEHKGIFKPFTTAALKRMGDRSVAALVEVRRDTDKDLRTFANKTLDGMGKFLPSDAVQVHDPQSLADVLTAFGKTKDPDAMRAIVPYLNADRAPVREAARAAIAAFGDAARPILDETYAQYTGDKTGADWSAKKILDSLLVAYDKVRLADVFKLFDEGIAHREKGELEEAIASFDQLLARAPQFERRAELAPAYLDLARKKEGDRAASRLLYAKAARLATGTPLAASIEAELLVLDTHEQLDRGIADTSLLHKALALDPNNPKAKELLARIEGDVRSKDDTFRRIALAAFVGVVVTVLAILFVGRKPPTKSPPPRPIRI
ncbi:MAG: tetratricopeptide repeat protein [Polyangiales bacterium]